MRYSIRRSRIPSLERHGGIRSILVKEGSHGGLVHGFSLKLGWAFLYWTKVLAPWRGVVSCFLVGATKLTRKDVWVNIFLTFGAKLRLPPIPLIRISYHWRNHSHPRNSCPTWSSCPNLESDHYSDLSYLALRPILWHHMDWCGGSWTMDFPSRIKVQQTIGPNAKDAFPYVNRTPKQLSKLGFGIIGMGTRLE